MRVSTCKPRERRGTATPRVRTPCCAAGLVQQRNQEVDEAKKCLDEEEAVAGPRELLAVLLHVFPCLKLFCWHQQGLEEVFLDVLGASRHPGSHSVGYRHRSDRCGILRRDSQPPKLSDSRSQSHFRVLSTCNTARLTTKTQKFGRFSSLS